MNKQIDNSPKSNIKPVSKKPQELYQQEEADPTIFGDWQHKGKVTDF